MVLVARIKLPSNIAAPGLNPGPEVRSPGHLPLSCNHRPSANTSDKPPIFVSHQTAFDPLGVFTISTLAYLLTFQGKWISDVCDSLLLLSFFNVISCLSFVNQMMTKQDTLFITLKDRQSKQSYIGWGGWGTKIFHKFHVTKKSTMA